METLLAAMRLARGSLGELRRDRCSGAADFRRPSNERSAQRALDPMPWGSAPRSDSPEGNDSYVIDFEGEPASTMARRRNKAHPLRDVAGMRRSIAYLGGRSGVRMAQALYRISNPSGGVVSPRYGARIGVSGLMPESLESWRRMTRMFELEKNLYDIDDELHKRPDWLTAPLIGVDRMFGEVSY